MPGKAIYEPLRGGKNAFGFGDFAQLTMVAFHRVGGIDQATDFGWKSEEGGQIFPVVFPGADGNRIFVTPLFSQLAEMGFSTFTSGSLIHLLQIEHESLAIRPSDVLQAVANLVNDATLDLGLGEDGQDRFFETAQSIHAGDENILHAATLQISDDTQPKVGAFTAIADPVAKRVFVALQIDTQYSIYGGL